MNEKIKQIVISAVMNKDMELVSKRLVKMLSDAQIEALACGVSSNVRITDELALQNLVKSRTKNQITKITRVYLYDFDEVRVEYNYLAAAYFKDENEMKRWKDGYCADCRYIQNDEYTIKGEKEALNSYTWRVSDPAIEKAVKIDKI